MDRTWRQNRRLFLAGAVWALAIRPGHADPVRLSADEIKTLLAGNTILGDWHGTPYRQFFDADGYTLYAPRGGHAENGRWRVDRKTGAYQSWWPNSGWTSYYIERDGDRLLWYDGGAGQPFEVLLGKQIDW